MGFCYPGTGSGGDLPPRPECAPLWHDRVLAQLPCASLHLLIGQYAIARYLGAGRKKTLGETVQSFREYQPGFFVITSYSIHYTKLYDEVRRRGNLRERQPHRAT